MGDGSMMHPKVRNYKGGDELRVLEGGAINCALGTFQIDGVAVTATAAELNTGTIAGITATAAELNALHSQAAVAADFAKLHALTSTAAEVNALHDQAAVAADFAKLHAITATAAEINKLDGCKLLAASSFVGGFQNHISTSDVNSGTYVSCVVGAGTYLKIVDVKMCARGGAASGASHVNVKMGSKVIMSVPVAALVEDKWVDLSTETVVTTNFNEFGADGEDVTVDKTGGSLATSTFIDLVVLYQALET